MRQQPFLSKLEIHDILNNIFKKLILRNIVEYVIMLLLEKWLLCYEILSIKINQSNHFFLNVFLP